MSKTARAMFVLALTASVVLVGCGGYKSSSTMTPPASRSAVGGNSVLSIGDSPSDNIISFEVTLNSVALTDSSGASVTVLNKPVRIELTHLAGTFVPLTTFSVPQGTYTSVTLTISNVEIHDLNAGGNTSEHNAAIGNGTFTIPISPNLIVGGAAMAVNLDFNVAQSVTFDASGNPTVNPVVVVSAGNASPADDDADHGKVDSVHGTVTQVTPQSFTVTVHEGNQSLTFNVDANTVFDGVAGISALATGMQVEVAASLQADGSLLATRVQAESEVDDERNAMEVEGLIVDESGSPTGQITVIGQQSSSSSNNAPAPGTMVDVTIDNRTNFTITDKMKTDSLPFTPMFGRATIAKGQNVEVDADGAMTTPLTARKLKLQQQALTGTISNVQNNSFTLTLAADSAFAMLTGVQSLTVYETSGTKLRGSAAVSDGVTVRVRGLLFSDGTTLRFVAGEVGKQ